MTLVFVAGVQYVGASGDEYSDGLYGACTYDSCPLTLVSSGTVSVNLIPTVGSTKCTIQEDVVGVTTDSSTGYTVTLNDTDTNNDLVGSTTSIPSTGGSQASPTALTTNKWGYRVDGIGGFGSGPTSSSSNISPPSTTFAAVPLSSGTPDTIATSSSPADPEVDTDVWYGVCVDTSIPADTYSDTVTYTATLN